MMMDGVLAPRLDSRTAGARPFNLCRPPVTWFLPAGTGDGLTATLLELVASASSVAFSGPFSFCPTRFT
jgi:hypothetical protein